MEKIGLENAACRKLAKKLDALTSCFPAQCHLLRDKVASLEVAIQYSHAVFLSSANVSSDSISVPLPCEVSSLIGYHLVSDAEVELLIPVHVFANANSSLTVLLGSLGSLNIRGVNPRKLSLHHPSQPLKSHLPWFLGSRGIRGHWSGSETCCRFRWSGDGPWRLR